MTTLTGILVGADAPLVGLSEAISALPGGGTLTVGVGTDHEEIMPIISVAPGGTSLTLARGTTAYAHAVGETCTAP